MQCLETPLLSCKGIESLRWHAFLHRSWMWTTFCSVLDFETIYCPSTCRCVWIASSSIGAVAIECSNLTTPLFLLLLSFHRLTFASCEAVHGMDVPVHGCFLRRNCTFVSSSDGSVGWPLLPFLRRWWSEKERVDSHWCRFRTIGGMGTIGRQWIASVVVDVGDAQPHDHATVVGHWTGGAGRALAWEDLQAIQSGKRRHGKEVRRNDPRETHHHRRNHLEDGPKARPAHHQRPTNHADGPTRDRDEKRKREMHRRLPEA